MGMMEALMRQAGLDVLASIPDEEEAGAGEMGSAPPTPGAGGADLGVGPFGEAKRGLRVYRSSGRRRGGREGSA